VEGAEQVHLLEEEEAGLVHYHHHHHDVMEEVVELIVMGEEVGHAHDVKVVGVEHFCLEEAAVLGYCVVEEGVELDHHHDAHVHALEGVGL